MESKSIRGRIGKNVARIRAERGHTSERVAKSMQTLGFKWSPTVVSGLENGKKPVSIAELLGLAYSLSSRDFKVKLSDLFEGEDHIELTDRWDISTKSMQDILNGGPGRQPLDSYPKLHKNTWEAIETGAKIASKVSAEISRYGKDIDINADEPGRLDQEFSGQAELKAAKTLKVSKTELMGACLALWGHSLTVERDSRAAGMRGQAKGHITRQLLEELRNHIEGTHGND